MRAATVFVDGSLLSVVLQTEGTEQDGFLSRALSSTGAGDQNIGFPDRKALVMPSPLLATG